MTSQLHIAEHFDEVAATYDFWKQKNWYYYDTLKAIARQYTPQEARLLDVGCGTGDIIAAVAPRSALGIDISLEMVELAKRKHRAYEFVAGDIVTYRSQEKFDTILYFDVIEHVIDARGALSSLSELLSPQGKLVVTMANPLWEPILMVGEKLGMKMPEGPHYRLPTGQFLALCERVGLQLVERQWRLIFPKYLPGISWLLNDLIGALPGIKRLSMIEVFVFEKERPE